MKRSISLRSQLVFSHLLVSLVSLVLISIYAGSQILEAGRDEVRNQLVDLALTASNGLGAPFLQFQSGDNNFNIIKDSIRSMLSNHPEIHYTIYDSDGQFLWDNLQPFGKPATRDSAPEVWQALQNENNGVGEAIRPGVNQKQALFIAVRIQRPEEVYGVLRLETEINAAPAMATARRSLTLLILATAVAALGVSLIGWILANNLTQPLHNLTQAAVEITEGNLGTRVIPAGPQEVVRLSEAFNRMASQLQNYLTELRAFVANASHELRTPLTVVKLRTEALVDGALEDPKVAQQFISEIDTEVDRLVRMVNDMLDLSRLEAGLSASQRTRLDLGVIANEVTEAFCLRAERAGIQLEFERDPDLLPVSANEDQIRRVLYNLVENAIRYTQSGGKVNLAVQNGRSGETVNILVKDNGPGIPPDHLAHLFERFYRVEAPRGRNAAPLPRGSGLGLAIAKSIVESFGGRIGVSSQVGEGSTFWVELPAVSA